MINEITQYPLGIFTTIQPILFLWVATISFFITISFVALVSKDRTWQWLAVVGTLFFVCMLVITLVASSAIVGISVIDFDVVWVPRSS